MKNPTTTNRTSRNGLSRACVAGGRTVISLAAILLVVMPFTEYYWHFDKFLQGGQDMEFGLLSIATVFCLVLVLSQQRRQGVIFLLALRRWLRTCFERTDHPAHNRSWGILEKLHPIPVLHSSLASYNLPIQI